MANRQYYAAIALHERLPLSRPGQEIFSSSFPYYQYTSSPANGRRDAAAKPFLQRKIYVPPIKLLAEYKKPEDIIGENGLLKQLTKALLERAMNF